MASDGRLDAAQCCLITFGLSAFILLNTLAPQMSGVTLPQATEVSQLAVFILLSFLVCCLGYRRLVSFNQRISDVRIRNRQLFMRLRELTLKANYDGLTGFPNERLLADRFNEALARVKRRGSTLAIYRITLADMDAIIQRHGGMIGAQVILELGVRLGGVLRDTDSIVRLKNSDYVLILESLNTKEKVDRVNRKIMRSLEPDFVLEGQAPITAQEKVAMAQYPKDGHTLEALMATANARMTKGKTLASCREIIAHEYVDVTPSQFSLLMTASAQ